VLKLKSQYSDNQLYSHIFHAKFDYNMLVTGNEQSYKPRSLNSVSTDKSDDSVQLACPVL